MDSTKKISFGFNKLNRKTNILLNKEPAKLENSKVQLIEYLEEQSIKVIGEENIVPAGPLVIPMKAPNKKLINLVDIVKNDFKDTIEDNQDKVDNAETSKDERTLTLDELAAKELINGLSNNNSKNDVTKVIEVPASENVTFEGEKESSLDDYESIPVDQFGKALLRGMGWKDGEGIGKNQQLVKVAQPVIRPKGMGLGADSITKKTDTPAAVDRNGKLLTCVKGAYVKVIAGYHKGNYGQILGFDDESGRFIIKLTLTNINVSLNEFLVKPVTKEDYNKNSKVLNNAKYEEYLKHKENSKKTGEKQGKKEPEENDERNTKISIKKELDYSSNDEQIGRKTDYSKVEVKKEKDYTKVEVKKEKDYTKLAVKKEKEEEKRRSRSHEEYTRKSREGKHKNKERNKAEKSSNKDSSRRKMDARRYSDSESESEDNRRTNKHGSDEEYATNKSSKRYIDTKKGKKANKGDCEYERRAYSSRRYSDSESEDRKGSNRSKKRDSEESSVKYERKSRKHSRNKRYNGSDSESDEKYERKSLKKDKYRDRSKHSTKDKRR